MKRHIFGASLFALIFSSCSFFTSLEENQANSGISINSISMAKTTLSTQVGSMEYISVSVKPVSAQKEVKLNWSYDSSIVQCDTSSNWGVTIKGLAEGQTTLRCSYGGYDAACMVTVNGYAENYENVTEPYIYSNYSILQTTPGVSEKYLFRFTEAMLQTLTATAGRSTILQLLRFSLLVSTVLSVPKIQVMQESRLRIIKPPTLTTSVFMFLRMLQTSAISQLQTTLLP